MAKIDISIPILADKFFDLRDALPGDCYNWSWVRPFSQVQYLAIHHTVSDDTQTPKEIADFHINNNGWGGIGYHFLIDKQGQVFYVGDMSTARANVSDMNEKVIGIGLIGNFIQGVSPTNKQLDSTYKLCQFLIEYPALKNINGWEAVFGHRELPKQSTICPGDNWQIWKKKFLKPTIKPTLKPTPAEKNTDILKSQIDNLQTSLAMLEQQRISLQEALQEREKEIANLKSGGYEAEIKPKADNTLTIIGAFINLYKFILPRKVETFA